MIVDFFDKIYTSIKGRNKFIAILRFSVRIMSNVIIPLVFRLSSGKIVNPADKKLHKKVVVSLTSFPARIGRIWLVIECMLRQSVLPDKIILYLAQSQFPHKQVDLPQKLKNYINNGQIEVKFVEDLRSHKKYFYSFQEYQDSLIILVDDDIFYPSYIVKQLLAEYKKHPDAVICSRGRTVRKDKEHFLPYKEWETLKSYAGPSAAIFHTSGGGTLYDPTVFVKDLFDKKVFLSYCKFADDVWLNIHLQRSNLKIVETPGYSEILPILNRSNALKHHNVVDGGNDVQLNNLIRYYDLDEKQLFEDKM